MNAILIGSHAERLGWVLMHSLWQFLAIALAVRLLERVFAGSTAAALRYAAGICGLAAITLAPIVTWVLIPDAPRVSAAMLDEPGEAQRAAPPRPLAMNRVDVAPVPAEIVNHPQSRRSPGDAWSAARATLTRRLRPWLPLLVAVWLLGVSLCSLRPLVGWLTLRRLRTLGLSTAGQATEESARRIAARLGLTRAVSVWQSAISKTPLVVGYLRPMLLMPVAVLAELSPAELEAILAHELAHVRRHDFLVNLWQMLLETVFYYHPAVWSLSHRLRAERENCCDDLAISIVGDPVCYGRALLHVEELRGAESFFAFGAGGSSLRGRILRLFGQPSPPSGAAGLATTVALSSGTIAALLAAFVWAAPAVTTDESHELAANKSAAADNSANGGADGVTPAPPAKPAAAERSLDIVVAKHVILWDGRIRTWDEVIAELREIRKAKGAPIHPHFHFTNEAFSAGHFDRYKAKVWEVYRELFQPAGMSFASISPRAGPRYDAIRKAEDLIPQPTALRSGSVIERGQPKAGALVVLVPDDGLLPIMLKPDLTLRDPFDEVWTVTDAAGHFTLNVEPAYAVEEGAPDTSPPKYTLAAISPAGFRLSTIPAADETATIELLPLARLELTPVEGKPQRIDLRLRGGLPAASPGFSIFEIDLSDKPLGLSLPAGEITVSRSFRHDDASSRSYPAETIKLGSGESRKVALPNISEAEAEEKWRADSIRGRDESGE